MGKCRSAIACYEEALKSARARNSHWNEDAWINNRANCYFDLGQAQCAIDYLRQNNPSAAQASFMAAIGEADALLAHTAENYKALDAKGLAQYGLALCTQNETYRRQAEQTGAAARRINKDGGQPKEGHRNAFCCPTSLLKRPFPTLLEGNFLSKK